MPHVLGKRRKWAVPCYELWEDNVFPQISGNTFNFHSAKMMISKFLILLGSYEQRVPRLYCTGQLLMCLFLWQLLWTLDESMIKSFYQKLKGKIKIINKPRPISNNIKNLGMKFNRNGIEFLKIQFFKNWFLKCSIYEMWLTKRLQ